MCVSSRVGGLDRGGARRHAGIAGACLVVLAVIAWCAAVQVDDGFERRAVTLDLEHPDQALARPEVVTDSPIAYIMWHRAEPLVVPAARIDAGFVIKLRMRSDRSPVGVVVLVGGSEVGRLDIRPEWASHELVVGSGGLGLQLQRLESGSGSGMAPEPIHISRISWMSTLGHAGPPLEGYLIADPGTDAMPWNVASPHLWPTIGIALAWTLALVVTVMVWLHWSTGACWWDGLARGLALVAPAAVLMAGLEILRLVSSKRVIYPRSSLLVLLVLVPALAAICSRPTRSLLGRTWGWLAYLEAGRSPETWKARTRIVATGVVLLLVAVVLVGLMPRTPFEWDEVLFARSLDHYDVAGHSPHPPGFPVYVAAAALVRVVIDDPVRATQAVSIVAALLCLVATGALVRRLGSGGWAPAGAALLLLVMPAFAFHANVGLSDVSGAAAAVAAVWALAGVLAGLETDGDSHGRDPGRLSGGLLGGLPARAAAASAVCALALGIRPQLLVALLVPGLWVVVHLVRRRRWAAMLAATGTGIGVSACCWLPPILITGASRFFTAAETMRRWVVHVEAPTRLPQAPLELVARSWLVEPFGSRGLAAAVWILVALGAGAWWRRGNRSLVLMACASGGVYLAAVPWMLQAETSVRYVLPALPFLAVLAAGSLAVSSARARSAAALGLVATSVALAAWCAPVLWLRRSDEAPVWAGLVWVREHLDPSSTTVVHDAGIAPHATYLLGGDAGFRLVSTESREAADPPGEHIAFVLSPDRLVGGELRFARAWSEPRLEVLDRGRYHECSVRGATDLPLLHRSPQLVATAAGWRLDGVGRVWVRGAGQETLLELEPSSTAVDLLRGSDGRLTLTRGCRVWLPIGSGPAPAVRLAAASGRALLGTCRLGSEPGHSRSRSARGRAARVDRLPELGWLPAVAHTEGRHRALWRSDLRLRNPTRKVVTCTLELLPHEPLGSPARATLRVPAGRSVEVTDAVLTLLGLETTGALAVGSSDPGLEVTCTTVRTVRTIPTSEATGAGERSAVLSEASPMSLVMPGDLLASDRPGRLRLPLEAGTRAPRMSLGLVNPGARPATVRLELYDRSGRALLRQGLKVAARTSLEHQLPSAILNAAGGSAELVLQPGGDRRVLALVTVDRPAPEHTISLPVLPISSDR